MKLVSALVLAVVSGVSFAQSPPTPGMSPAAQAQQAFALVQAQSMIITNQAQLQGLIASQAALLRSTHAEPGSEQCFGDGESCGTGVAESRRASSTHCVAPCVSHAGFGADYFGRDSTQSNDGETAISRRALDTPGGAAANDDSPHIW